MKQYIGDGMLLITAIVWGSGFVVTAIALEYLTAYQVMAGRFILAAMILSLLFGKKFKTFTKSVIWKGAILGTILYIGFALQTVGLEYTTPSKNAFLTAVNVVIVPLIAYLVYKRKVDRYETIGVHHNLNWYWLFILTRFNDNQYWGCIIACLCCSLRF